MKKNAYASGSNIIPFSRRKGYAYPNAAEPGYFADRILDGLTALAICVGVVTVLFFLATM